MKLSCISSVITLLTLSAIMLLTINCNTGTTHSEKRQEVSHKDTVSNIVIVPPTKEKLKQNNPISWQTMNMDEYKDNYYKNLLQIPIFKGYTDGGGIVIESIEEVEYGLAHLHNEDTHVMLLEKFNRPSYYELEVAVVCAIKMKGVASNQNIGFGICEINGTYDSNIIAVFQNEDEATEYYEKVVKAWMLDRKNNKFVEISTKNIKCINEGFGA